MRRGDPPFKRLRVWQEATLLARDAFALADQLPLRYGGLANQLRDSADSVPSNIAEGHGRPSRREYARYLVIARGSLHETESRIALIRTCSLAPAVAIDAVQTRLDHVEILLSAVLRSLNPRR